MPHRRDRDRKRDKRRALLAEAEGYLSADSPAAAGKYFQVFVPSWGEDGANVPLSSFLRLGNTTDGAPTTKFQTELVAQFTGFFDDPRQRADGTTGAAVQTLPGVTGAGSDGLGAAGVDDGGLSVTQRATETDALQSKGGWMDHSDGNRITTTQGDKVEVIRGNYQLIVLGRQDSVGNGALLDMSGGLAQPNDATPANLMRLEWVRNYDGTWRSVEECQKGDVHNVIHGDVFEEQYGQSITSITGSEHQPVLCNPETYDPNPADADGTAAPAVITENNDLFDPQSPAYLGPTAQSPTNVIETKMNPVILERTWAESISSYTGSSTTRIPKIHEETWAKDITEVTNCSGTINSTTTAGVVEEVTEVGSINEVTTVGAKIEVTLAALQLDLEIGGKIDLHFGPKFSAEGPEKLHFSIEENKIMSASTKATLEEQKLTAIQTRLTEAETNITATNTRIDEESTKLSTLTTECTDAFTVLSEAVNL
ncbi:MAG: hypothetical protein ABSE49_06810 [Polyangiaceae bacterium]|jgi:hypothetical protein